VTMRSHCFSLHSYDANVNTLNISYNTVRSGIRECNTYIPAECKNTAQMLSCSKLHRSEHNSVHFAHSTVGCVAPDSVVTYLFYDLPYVLHVGLTVARTVAVYGLGHGDECIVWLK